MISIEYIEKLTEDALGTEELFIVDISVDQANKIKVVLDSDKTVSIQDCIAVSRSIEHNLDRDEEDFSIEVTSAGLGQPLKMLRQYSKHIGRQLEITVDSGIRLSGELKNVSEEFVELLQKNAGSKKKKEIEEPMLHRLALNTIKQAKAIITI